jgi:hypothetical protein
MGGSRGFDGKVSKFSQFFPDFLATNCDLPLWWWLASILAVVTRPCAALWVTWVF